MSDEIWTLKEVARYLRVSPSSVYGWVRHNALPAAKVGKQWRFSKRAITQWLARQNKTSIVATRAHIASGHTRTPALTA